MTCFSFLVAFCLSHLPKPRDSRILSPDSFSSFPWGKSSRKIPCRKILQKLYNKNPRHISEGLGQACAVASPRNSRVQKIAEFGCASVVLKGCVFCCRSYEPFWAPMQEPLKCELSCREGCCSIGPLICTQRMHHQTTQHRILAV